MILRGWKAICDELGGVSINCARRLARNEGLPVAHIAGRPLTTTSALEAWVEKHVKKNKLPPERTSLPPERTSAHSQ
jgi:hypothetical protein